MEFLDSGGTEARNFCWYRGFLLTAELNSLVGSVSVYRTATRRNAVHTFLGGAWQESDSFKVPIEQKINSIRFFGLSSSEKSLQLKPYLVVEHSSNPENSCCLTLFSINPKNVNDLVKASGKVSCSFSSKILPESFPVHDHVAVVLGLKKIILFDFKLSRAQVITYGLDEILPRPFLIFGGQNLIFMQTSTKVQIHKLSRNSEDSKFNFSPDPVKVFGLELAGRVLDCHFIGCSNLQCSHVNCDIILGLNPCIVVKLSGNKTPKASINLGPEKGFVISKISLVRSASQDYLCVLAFGDISAETSKLFLLDPDDLNIKTSCEQVSNFILGDFLGKMYIQVGVISENDLTFILDKDNQVTSGKNKKEKSQNLCRINKTLQSKVELFHCALQQSYREVEKLSALMQVFATHETSGQLGNSQNLLGDSSSSAVSDEKTVTVKRHRKNEQIYFHCLKNEVFVSRCRIVLSLWIKYSSFEQLHHILIKASQGENPSERFQVDIVKIPDACQENGENLSRVLCGFDVSHVSSCPDFVFTTFQQAEEKKCSIVSAHHVYVNLDAKQLGLKLPSLDTDLLQLWKLLSLRCCVEVKYCLLNVKTLMQNLLKTLMFQKKHDNFFESSSSLLKECILQISSLTNSTALFDYFTVDDFQLNLIKLNISSVFQNVAELRFSDTRC